MAWMFRQRFLFCGLHMVGLFSPVIQLLRRKTISWLPKKEKGLSPSRAMAVSDRLGTCPPYPHAAFSEESCRKAAAFQPRSSDVFIVTAPKTGTTFLQMLCHSLRTSGDEHQQNFQDIYQVVPWDQLAWDLGQNLDEEQVAFPRLFKSHLRLASINRGAKYIALVRRPEDVLQSWWRFLREKDVPALRSYSCLSEFVFDKDFVAENMRFGASLWEYYIEFYLCRDLSEVLVLCFEDLQDDLAGHLELISSFLGCPVTDAARQQVLQLCSREAMAALSRKFDETWTYEELTRLGRSPDAAESFRPASRVHLEKTASPDLDEAAKCFLQKKWGGLVEARTGLRSYEELVEGIREEVKKRKEMKTRGCRLGCCLVLNTLRPQKDAFGPTGRSFFKQLEA